MAVSDPIEVTNLRTELEARRASIIAEMGAGGGVNGRPHAVVGPLYLASLADTASLLSRSIAWTQQDDQDVDGIHLRVTDATASRTVTARLTVDDGSTNYLLDSDFEATETTVIGTADGVTDFRTTTGNRVRLKKGVRYRLEIQNESSGTTIGGPLQASLVVKPRRRGGSSAPFLLPNGLRVGGVLDPEKINANLMALKRASDAAIDQRYTYSTSFYDLSGLVDTDSLVQRQFAIRAPGASRTVTVCAVELVLTNATAATVWTASKQGDATWGSISATGGGADVESAAIRRIDIQSKSNSADTLITLTPSTSSGTTITRGYLVVHWRCDRWQQAVSLLRWTPDLLDASKATDADVLQDQLDDLDTVIALAAEDDLRVVVCTWRNIGTGQTRTFQFPGGLRTVGQRVQCYLVGPASTSGRFTVGGASTDLAGTGSSNRITGGHTPTLSGNSGELTDSADDTTVYMEHLGGGGGDIDLMYAVLWTR